MRSRLAFGLDLCWTLAGLVLAMMGLLMVADRLSLRGLLAGTGPEAVRQLVVSLHLEIEHSGAQVVELGGALVGAAIVLLSVRRLIRLGWGSRPGAGPA